MAWTALSFSVGQVLTAAQMNNLYANFAAIAAGNSGAPVLAPVLAAGTTALSQILGSNPFSSGLTSSVSAAESSLYTDNISTISISSKVLLRSMTAGVVRVYFTSNTVTSGHTIYIYKNGASVYSSGLLSNAGVQAISTDITIAVGDIFVMHCLWNSVAGTHTVYNVYVAVSATNAGIT
jgi:hypothetical protein